MRLTPGSVISGTLRTQDLLNAFAHELALHKHGENTQLINDAIFWSSFVDPENQPIYDNILDDLSFKLNELCPVGYYFGAHPDDATDFGIWQRDDWSEMITGYEQWLDDEASKADYDHQYMKEQENDV